MAERDSGARRGLFRRAAREQTPEQAPLDSAPRRRERRSTGEMFSPRQSAVDDPWSSDAWADDGWNDEWDDPSRRVSIRPAAAPRSAAVDAWLESDQVEFADVTADIARKWAPDRGVDRGIDRGITWDEPEPVGAPFAQHVVEPTPKPPSFLTQPAYQPIAEAIPEPVYRQRPELASEIVAEQSDLPHETTPEPAHEIAPEPAHEILPEPAHEIAPEPAHEETSESHAAAAIAAAVPASAFEGIAALHESPAHASRPSVQTEPISWVQAPEAHDEPTYGEPTHDEPTHDEPAHEPAHDEPEFAETPETPGVDASDSVMGTGWDDEPIDWKDDPVIRSLDDDFVDTIQETPAEIMAPEFDRRSVPRALKQSLVPAAYDELDRSIDLDLAEELDQELPPYVRRSKHKTVGRTTPPTKSKKRSPQPASPKRAAIGSSAPHDQQLATSVGDLPTSEASEFNVDDEEFWDDIDPNALATSKLDLRLADESAAAAAVGPESPVYTGVAMSHQPDSAADTTAIRTRDGQVRLSAESSGSAKALVRLFLTSGLGLAALAVLRLVVAVVATVKASTEITSFGDRLVDAANNLGPEQGVLLILSISLVILGKFASLGKVESIARLTGRVCGIVLAAASATLLLGVAKLMNALGADDSNFAGSAQAVVEFLSFGGMSLIAMYGAWTSAAD